MSVLCPTSTPFTSTIEFRGPGSPSNGTPRSRALGLLWAAKDQAQLTASGIARQSLMGPLQLIPQHDLFPVYCFTAQDGCQRGRRGNIHIRRRRLASADSFEERRDMGM